MDDQGFFKKPLLVYMPTRDPKAKKLMKLVEGTILKDERVALATRFFTCIRVDGDNPPTKGPLAGLLKGKKLPRFVVISRDKSVIKRVEGRIKASSLFSAMKRVAKVDYKTSLASYVTKMRKLLNEMDKVDQKQKAYELALKRKKAKPKDKKKLDEMRRRLEEKEKKLNQIQMRELNKKKRRRG